MLRPPMERAGPEDQCTTPWSMGCEADGRERILIIRHGAFGDLIQSEGALRDIRAHHRDARISLLVAPAYAKLMARCPHVDELILDSRAPLAQFRRNLGVLRKLHNADFHRVYDLQGSFRTGLCRKLLGRRRRWFRRNNPSSSQRPDRDAYVEMLNQAGVPARHVQHPDVRWMADDITPVLAAHGVRPGYVALVPGSAARHAHKRWPHYANLARMIQTQGRQVVIAPGPDEMELARELSCIALQTPSGHLDWFALAGFLRHAAFVVGNDTGPTHLAACVGTPGLALFGPHTTPERTGIRLRAFEAIQVRDLWELSAADVLQRMESRLSSAA